MYYLSAFWNIYITVPYVKGAVDRIFHTDNARLYIGRAYLTFLNEEETTNIPKKMG